MISKRHSTVTEAVEHALVDLESSPSLLWLDVPMTPHCAAVAHSPSLQHPVPVFATMGELDNALADLYSRLPRYGLLLVVTQGSLEEARVCIARKQRYGLLLVICATVYNIIYLFV